MPFNHVLTGLKTGRTGVGAVKMLQLMESRPQQGRVDKIIEEECRRLFYLLHPHSSYFQQNPLLIFGEEKSRGPKQGLKVLSSDQ